MDLEQILHKLQLGVKYKQNCELGYGDSHTLSKHIDDLKNAISDQNKTIIELKTLLADALSKTVQLVSTSKKKGKHK